MPPYFAFRLYSVASEMPASRKIGCLRAGLALGECRDDLLFREPYPLVASVPLFRSDFAPRGGKTQRQVISIQNLFITTIDNLKLIRKAGHGLLLSHTHSEGISTV